jgi:hypothetical protein
VVVQEIGEEKFCHRFGMSIISMSYAPHLQRAAIIGYNCTWTYTYTHKKHTSPTHTLDLLT